MSHILRKDRSLGPEIGERVIAQVYRFDPTRDEAPRFQEYSVPYRGRMTVQTLLREIYEHIDPTLAFRNQQCGRGICGTCSLRIGVEGRLTKGCNLPVGPGDRVVIAPTNRAAVIRDIVVST